MLGILGAGAAFPARAVEIEASGAVRGAAQATPNALLISQITSGADLRQRLEAGDGTSEALGVLLNARLGLGDRFVPAVGWRIGLDTGLVDFDAEAGVFGDGRPIGDHVERTLLLGETYLDLQPREDGSLVLRFGKLRTVIADGVVFSGQSLGASLDLNLAYQPSKIPLRLVAFAGLPDGGFQDTLTSPLFHLAAIWSRGAHTFTFSQSLLWDRSSALLPLLVGPSLATDLDEGPIRLRLDPEASQGWISWTGLAWRWALEGFELRLLGVIATGEERLQGLRRPRLLAPPAPDELSFGLLSGFGKVEARIEGGPVAFEPFLLAASGARDLGPEGERRWTAFPSLAPLVPLTRYFLGAATLPAQQQPVLQSLAPDGAGLLGVGLSLDWRLGDWSLRGTGAHFRSFGPPNPAILASRVGPEAVERFFGTLSPAQEAARTYGTEFDLQLDWFFSGWGYASAEGAVFATGDFFGTAPAGWQAFLGFGFFYDSRPRLL